MSKEGLHKPLIPATVVYAQDGAAVKKQASVLIIRDTFTNVVTTGSNGIFYPRPADLVTPEDKLFSATANAIEAKERNIALVRYAVIIGDPMQAPLSYLQRPELSVPREEAFEQSGNAQVLEEVGNSKMLETVMVSAQKHRLFTDASRRNLCGDYVCEVNIFNCPVHFGDARNTIPIKGGVYRIHHTMGGGEIVYQGCTGSNLSRINTARLFTGLNEKIIVDKETEHYLSTLYWSPLLQVSGKASLSFFSGDLPGRYKIIVEGVAENGDILQEEKDILVVEPVKK